MTGFLTNTLSGRRNFRNSQK